MKRCLECNRLCSPADSRRGLCGSCRRSPECRFYPSLPRGAWLPGAKAWTTFDVVELLDLIDRGWSDEQIAERMGRTVQGVSRKRRRLNKRQKREEVA